MTTSLDFLSVHVGDFDNIRVAGQQANIWHTADKGQTWVKEYEESGYNLNDIINIGTDVAYAVGWDGKILETIDNGSTWEQKNSGLTSTLYDVKDQWAHE